jgi:DNA-binding transcriptional regulator GbsR (MarR family)
MSNLNTLEDKFVDQDLTKLADSVGDFIRYWGFRRVHGQIWTLLYLKNQAISPTEIAKSLGVSKSLISSALVELEDHKLIMPVDNEITGNKKTKFFKAESDVIKIIQDILKNRELKLINSVKENIDKLQKKKNSVDPERLASLELWTSVAQASVTGISELTGFEDAPTFS